jgi:hypothetical protein
LLSREEGRRRRVVGIRLVEYGECAAAGFDQLGDLVPGATAAPHERDEGRSLEVVVVRKHQWIEHMFAESEDGFMAPEPPR